MISGIVSTPGSYPFYAWSDEKNVYVSMKEKSTPTMFKKAISHLNPKKVSLHSCTSLVARTAISDCPFPVHPRLL